MIKRIASAALLAAALGCSSGDGESTTPSTDPVSAAGGTGAPAPTATPKQAQEAPEPAVHASVPRCLDLVRDGKLVEAVAPCTEAVKNAPGNEEVADALARAEAAASEQASAAARSAAGADAASSLQEKSGSLPTQLP